MLAAWAASSFVKILMMNMCRIASPFGRAPLAAALALGLSGPALAQSVTWEGLNPNDPIGSVTRRIVELVRTSCLKDGRNVVFGVSPFDIGTMGLNKDQLVHLEGAVHSALSRTPDVETAPFKDVMAIHELQNAGLTSGPQHAEIQAMLNRVQVVIQPSGAKSGRDFRMRLRAIGRGGVTCDVLTELVNVPPHLTGELFETADNLFQKAARDLRDRSTGRTEVAVSARSLDGEPLPPHLPDYFTAQMSVAATSTEQTSTIVLGRDVKFDIYNAERRPPTSKPRWDAEVSVLERPTGYRLTIALNHPDSGNVAHAGLVQPDQLPPIRRPARSAGQQRRAPGGDEALRLRATPVRVADLVDDRRPTQGYSFNLATESYVELDIPSANGRAVEMPPVVLDGRGQVIQPFNPRGSRPNLRRYRLQAGAYRITVTNPSRSRMEYILAARAVPVRDMLLPEPPGRLTAQFQDWYVGEIGNGPRRACYAFTPATSVSPADWREQVPVIWMGLQSDQDGALNHYLDLAERYREGAPFGITITGPDGRRDLSAAPIGRHVSPVIAGRSGEPVLDREAVRGYTRGGELTLTGTLPDGREARVTYSLSGYRSAASAMARACGRLDLARDLVWR